MDAGRWRVGAVVELLVWRMRRQRGPDKREDDRASEHR
jgi:hypothetical protein